MRLPHLLVIGLPLLLTGCDDPFFENGPDMMMPAAATMGGQPATYGQPMPNYQNRYQPNGKPAQQGTQANTAKKSSNNAASSGSSATTGTQAETPAANTTPMIPDSPPMI